MGRGNERNIINGERLGVTQWREQRRNRGKDGPEGGSMNAERNLWERHTLR